VLPTITKIDGFVAPSSGKSGFVTAFHLDGWRLKGMPNLLAAIAFLKQKHLDITLDIVGGGSRQATAALEREIRRYGLGDSVALCGPMPHDRMPEALNGYAALVLPTLRESFGMVYVEALFSGVPILYSQDRGIDGYFDVQDVGVRCDPLSVTSIARGLEELRVGVPRMKENIRKLQKGGGFDRFRKSNVCRGYEEILEEVCDKRMESGS
jgi:glycosyltransferase involved in cell wall biosynthesis